MVIVHARLYADHVLTEDSDRARDFFSKSYFGTVVHKCISLSFFEALYLCEKNKLLVFDGRKRALSFEELFERIQRKSKQARLWYLTYCDLRSKGYVVQSGVKFGAAFRVYDKGHEPGKEHAKWVVVPVPETYKLSMTDLAAHARVSHSTRKHLLLAVIDSEDTVTYYDISWTRP